MLRNWSRARILFELKERGTTAAAVAQQEKLSRSTLYSAMERPYPRVHDLIAKALDLPRQHVWPTFYGEDGQRLSRREVHRRDINAQSRNAA
jgi:Ner family transcriptional regulator